MTHTVLNFAKAYATYCAYCRASGVSPETIQEFARGWRANAAQGHEGCNYDYHDPEVIETISKNYRG